MRTPSFLLVLTSSALVSAQPAPVDPPPAPEPEPAPTPRPPPLDDRVKPIVVVTPPAKPEPKSIAASYSKGVLLKTADDTFELRLNLRSQMRFETTRPTEDDSQFASRFLIPRARLTVDGAVWSVRYKLEAAFGDNGSFGFLKDLWIDKKLDGPVWLRAGLWRRPFNRQEIVSDFASELNERANTATFVGGGRDLGVGFHNDFEKSPDGIEWAVGVFNGFSGGGDRPVISTACTENTMTSAISCTTPAPTNLPSDFGPAVVARVGWNTGGIKGYSEGDLEGGPARFAIGLNYKIDLANLAKGKEASLGDNVSHGLGADAMIKVTGFSLQLGAFVMKLKSADAKLGYLVQPGYFVVPKRAQVAARFAYAPVGSREQIEARVAFSWLWEGHAWKWSTDVGFLKLTGTDPTTMASDKPDAQLRTMLQLTF